MYKVYRVISTFLIVVGIGFLCFYCHTQDMSGKFTVFGMPSYYILQNYRYIFLAGITVVAFSILGNFFSWFKSIEEKEEILPNAGYSDKESITAWVGGSSLDTETVTGNIPAGTQEMKAVEADRTEILPGDDQTKILAETEKLPEDDQTEILAEEEKTEVLDEIGREDTR